MTIEARVIERREQPAAVLRARVAHDGIPEFLGRAFGAVLDAVGGESGVAGPPFARYDLVPEGFDIMAGFPVKGEVSAGGEVELVTLPGGTVAETTHVGAYEDLGGTYGALEAWLAGNGLAPAGGPWESYLDGPEVERPRTLVSWPCQRV